MRIIRTPEEVRNAVKSWRREGLTVGLVPTMGFLHEGHASLIERAVRECDRVVVSVFVNPMQFGPNEDLQAYPRDFERDCKLIDSLGAHVVFHPEPSDMYLPGATTTVSVSGLTEGLCGKTRPTHFAGVCTVVSKLFHIAAPDRVYFGQKDAQQLAVVRRMVKDLNFDLEVVGCPIVREADGLAKSSRNSYLNEQERRAAVVLFRALNEGKKLLAAGSVNVSEVVRSIRSVIEAEPLARVDYVEVVDALSMQPVSEIKDETLVAVAVYIGKTRLIDNFLWSK